MTAHSISESTNQRIPTLVGLSLREAKARAAAAGLTLEISVDDQPSSPRLQVLSQNPSGDTAVNRDLSEDAERGVVQIRVAMPSWLRHLPEVFEEADTSQNGFLRRYLLLSQHLLIPVEERIANSGCALSPSLAEPAELPRLASWLGLRLHDGWDDARRRHVLSRAPLLWATRGTPHGLRLALELLANVRATIVEHPPSFATARIGDRFRIGIDGAVGQPIPEWHWIQVVVDEALDARQLALVHFVIASHAPAHARWVVARRRVEKTWKPPSFQIGRHAIGQPPVEPQDSADEAAALSTFDKSPAENTRVTLSRPGTGGAG